MVDLRKAFAITEGFSSRSLQGAALILFNIFINDLEENIKSLLTEFVANKKKTMKREKMTGIGQGRLERRVHLNACFNTTKCKVILQEKINPIYKGGGGCVSYQAVAFIGGFSSCNR